MFFTFLIMLAIELSLLWHKPSARIFAGTVLLFGLILRGLAAEYAAAGEKSASRRAGRRPCPASPAAEPSITTFTYKTEDVSGAPMMCAIRGAGKTLDFAIEESKANTSPALFAFCPHPACPDRAGLQTKWQEDEEARDVFQKARSKAGSAPGLSRVTRSATPWPIPLLILRPRWARPSDPGRAGTGGLVNLLRGNIIRDISDNLPDDIHLLVVA